MAKSTISGLTVAIGADTKGFQEKIRELDRVSKNVAKDLKTVSESMKLDPTAIQHYADKFKLLQEAVDVSAKKVQTAKDAIAALSRDLANGKISPEEYAKSLEALKRQLESAEYEHERSISALREYDKATKDAISATDDLGDEHKETAEEIEKTNKSYLLFYERTSKASDEQRELTDALDDFDDAANNAQKGTLSLADVIKGSLLSKAIQKGFESLVNLAKSLARHLLEAGKALAQFSWDAVKSAAEFKDAIGYSETVYGKMSESALQWAKDNSEGLRISEKTLVQYMNTLGQVFHSQGMKEAEALDITESLMKMAADLRAAIGMTTDEILPVMMRGFTTSVKNFRQFGVIMTDAEVKAYALANGLAKVSVDETKLAVATANLHDAQKKANDALTKYGEGSVELEKAEANLAKAEEKYNEVLGGEVDNFDAATIVKARYLLLSERLKNINGQNTKESELFNSQLALTETKFKNLTDQIGMKLLPVFTDLITFFNNFLSSDAGKQILNDIVDQFAKWAKIIQDWVDSGGFAEFLNDLGENLPNVVNDIGEFVNKVVELIPQIAELTTKLMEFLGLNTEVNEAKKAYVEHRDEVHKFAKSLDEDFTTVINAIKAYAVENGLKMSEIYNDWGHYEPLIKGYIHDITTTTEGAQIDLKTALDKMPEDMQEAINKMGNTDVSALDVLRMKIGNIVSSIGGYITDLIDRINTADSIGDVFFRNLPGRASGGAVRAGQMYQVNDDAGHRPEIFVPAVNGYILNGNQTDRIVNNSTSSTVGDVNIYLNSFGADATSIANEIGIAVQQKLRMSGAMLY